MSFVDHEALRTDHPARVVLTDGATGRTLTAGQLADGARRVAGGLAERGLGRGRNDARRHECRRHGR